MEQDGFINEPMSAPQGVKLLVCIVDSAKADSYIDFLTSFGINISLTTIGHGTYEGNTKGILGPGKQGKALIFAPVPSDRSKELMSMIEKKFKTIRNGKGIAFTVPMTGTVGVLAYRFLCDLR